MVLVYAGRPQRPTGCQTVGRLIREARQARGLSQRDLAKQLASTGRPIRQATVAQWEGAFRRIAAVDLALVELALDVEFCGINRRLQPLHNRHGRHYCAVDLASGKPGFDLLDKKIPRRLPAKTRNAAAPKGAAA